MCSVPWISETERADYYQKLYNEQLAICDRLQEEIDSKNAEIKVLRKLLDKAEVRIEATEKECQRVIALYNEKVCFCNEQKAEIERLKGYNENLLTANTALSNEILDIRAEAIKEFAERLRKALVEDGIYPAFAKNIIDNLVKEMTEEK